MKKIFLLSLMILTFVFSIATVHTRYVYAVDGDGETSGVIGDGTEDTATIVNPIGVDSIQGFIERLLGIILKLGIPLVALAIIYAGFKFVMAQGNASKLEEAKSTFLYTLIGAALLLGAWVIGSIVKATIEAIAKP